MYCTEKSSDVLVGMLLCVITLENNLHYLAKLNRTIISVVVISFPDSQCGNFCKFVMGNILLIELFIIENNWY
jgi:hypothetical protein